MFLRTNSDLANRRRYITGPFLLFVILCLSGADLFGEEELDLDAMIKSLPRTAGDPNAGVRAQLMVLGEVQGTLWEIPFYQRCLDQIAKNPGKADIPALESLLNSSVYWEYPRTNTSGVIQSLREKASKIWYDLVWTDADETTKIKTALYGFQPDPPVRPDHQESFNRMKQLGKAGRAVLYNTLTRQHAKMNYDDGWIVNGVSTAISLLQKPEFTPTKAELERLLKSPGAFGQQVGLGYAAQTSASGFAESFDKYVSANLDDPRSLYRVSYYTRYASNLKPEEHLLLTKALITIGQLSQKQINESQHQLPEPVWFGMLYRVNMVLHEIGPGPEGEKYLQEYLTYRKQLNTAFIERGNEQYQFSVKSFLDEADSRAKAALSEEE